MSSPISALGSAIASPQSASAAAASTQAPTVDYNSFLQLLVQEMKNQDPTAPSDPMQFMSQLASFSNVEQGVNTNTKLDTLLTTSSLTQAETVIGKNVTSADGSISGTVTAVGMNTNGATTALLSNGSTLTLDNSVIISAPAAATS